MTWASWTLLNVYCWRCLTSKNVSLNSPIIWVSRGIFHCRFYWSERSSLAFEESVICPPEAYAFFVPKFHESIREPLRGAFANEHLEVLSCCIERSPVTWIWVILELFSKVLEVLTGNREFIVPKWFTVFVGGLERHRTIGRFADNFYQIYPDGGGINFLYEFQFAFDNFMPFFQVGFVNPCFPLRAEGCGRAATNDSDGYMPPFGSSGEELNIFISSQSEGLVCDFSRYQA